MSRGIEDHRARNALWPGVEVRHLATLEAIARARSFRGAAGALGYAQSAVSQHVAQLEDAVGVSLVERGNARHSVRLTASGRRLLHHARGILLQLKAARIDLNGGDRPVRIGFGAGIVCGLLPGLAVPAAAWPDDMRVEFWEPANEDELPQLVEHGRLDLAVGAPIPAGTPFAAQPLIADQWVLVAAADSPLDRAWPCADVVWPRLLAPLPSQACERALDELAGTVAGGAADVVRRPAGPAMQAEVASGEAVALMPRLAVDVRDPKIRVIPTTLTPRLIGVYWLARRRSVAIMEPFIAAVRELLQGRAPDRA